MGADSADVPSACSRCVDPHLGKQGACVVADGLGAPGTARRRAGEAVLDAQAGGVHLAALEVGADGRRVDCEGVGRGGLDAEDGAGAEDERADVKGALPGGRHPPGVGAGSVSHGLDEERFGDGRDALAFATVPCTPGIAVGPEKGYATIGAALCFHAFEYALTIVQDSGAWRYIKAAVRLQLAVGPVTISPALAEIHDVCFDAAPWFCC